MRIAEARETNDPLTRSSRETHLARASGKPGIPAEAGARALGDRLASFSQAEQELMENGQTFPNLTGKVKNPNWIALSKRTSPMIPIGERKELIDAVTRFIWPWSTLPRCWCARAKTRTALSVNTSWLRTCAVPHENRGSKHWDCSSAVGSLCFIGTEESLPPCNAFFLY